MFSKAGVYEHKLCWTREGLFVWLSSSSGSSRAFTWHSVLSGSHSASRSHDNCPDFNVMIIQIVSGDLRSLFLTKASEINIANNFYASCFQLQKSLVKGRVHFQAPKKAVRKPTPLQNCITTREVHLLQAIGRKKKVSIRNCRQKLVDVRNASALYNSLKRSLVSCHETFLFFKWACQVCQPKLYIYVYYWDFKALPGDAAEKQSWGWAAG